MDFHVSLIFVNLILTVFIEPACHGPVRDERVIQLDKEPATGRLEKQGDAGFGFRTSGGDLVPIDRIRRLENTAPARISSGPSPAHRLYLWGTESLSGVIESLDDEQIRLASPAGDRLRVPLALVRKVVHFQGDAVVLRDDFELDDSPRKLTGQARRSHDQAATGQWSAQLSMPGDCVEYQLDEPLVSGWFEARFWDSGEVRPAPQWVCEFDFESNAGIRTVQVVLGSSADSYALATPQGPSLPVQRIARHRGWSRLAMRFSADRITLLVDDAVLTHRAVGAGLLQSVRFVVRPGDDAEAESAKDSPWSGWIDDLQIAASLAAPTEHQPSRDQDDILLTSGDQLFGRIEHGSSRDLTILGEFGPQQLPWSQLHEVYFTPRRAMPRAIDGQHVRIEFAATVNQQAATPDNDVLEGVLRDVTDETIAIEQPYIGLVRIPRDQMRSIEFFASGRWLAIDPGFHHFGEQVNVRLQVPHPAGSDRNWEFELQEVPKQAVLVLQVVLMQAMPVANEANKRAPNDEWRTYATINDKLLDPLGLNHLLALNYRGPARLTLPVPADTLKKGTNVLRIYQTPLKDDPRSFDDCGIFAIGLELPAK